MSVSSVSSCHSRSSIDWLFWICLTLLSGFFLLHVVFSAWLTNLWLQTTAQAVFELLSLMWWGIAIGIVAVAVIARVPRSMLFRIIGTPHKTTSVLRATFGGITLDMCNHGVILIAMQLYKRGASLGQVMAFLIATPWNSLSLAIILASLVGWDIMLLFTALSAVIAFLSGLLFDALVTHKILPANPYSHHTPPVTEHKPVSTTSVSWLVDAIKESQPYPALAFPRHHSGCLNAFND